MMESADCLWLVSTKSAEARVLVSDVTLATAVEREPWRVESAACRWEVSAESAPTRVLVSDVTEAFTVESDP